MVTSRELRTKAKMLDVIQRMPEDGSIDDAIYRLGVLKAVAEGIEAAEEGRVYDHDEVFDELLNDDPNRLERTSKAGLARTKEPNRGGRTKRRARVRQKAKGGR
jgi:hypothetical protein